MTEGDDPAKCSFLEGEIGSPMDVPSPWLHAALVEDLIQVRAHPADAATTDREVRALADVAAL